MDSRNSEPTPDTTADISTDISTDLSTDPSTDLSTDNRRRHTRLNLERKHPVSAATLHIQGLDHPCVILNFSPCGVCLLLPEGLAMAVGDCALVRMGHGDPRSAPGHTVVKRWGQITPEGMIAGFEFLPGHAQGRGALLTALGQGAGMQDPLTGMGWLEPEA